MAAPVSSEDLSQCFQRAKSARNTDEAPESDPNRPVVPPFGMLGSIRACAIQTVH